MSSSSDPPDDLSSPPPAPSPPTGFQKWSQALRLMKWQDVQELPTYPCARNSLLMGIGGGMGVFALRTLTVSTWTAGNWGVGAFVFISIFSWETCTAKYRKEKQEIRTIIEQYPERRVKSRQQRAEEEKTF